MMKTIALICGILLLISCSDPWGPGIAITVTSPPAGGAQADNSYIINWILDVRGYSHAGIDLFVDTDLDPKSGLIQIAESLSVESTGFLWDCSLFPEDDYYVRAFLYEGSSSVSDYSDGTVTVSHN